MSVRKRKVIREPRQWWPASSRAGNHMEGIIGDGERHGIEGIGFMACCGNRHNIEWIHTR